MNSSPPWVWRHRKNPRSTPSANTSTPAHLHFSAELTARVILEAEGERRRISLKLYSLMQMKSRGTSPWAQESDSQDRRRGQYPANLAGEGEWFLRIIQSEFPSQAFKLLHVAAWSPNPPPGLSASSFQDKSLLGVALDETPDRNFQTPLKPRETANKYLLGQRLFSPVLEKTPAKSFSDEWMVLYSNTET